jgi:hypothetical protein
VQEHQKLINYWQREFEMRYGPGYYRDDWDKEAIEHEQTFN